MQTKCPACQTVFHVQRDQLKQADGLVRCGQCRKIFNGREHLVKGRDRMTQTPDMIKHMLLGRRESSPAATAAWSLALTLATLALLLQIAWVQREWLAARPHIGEYVETACDSLSWCELSPQRDPGQIQLVSRNVYSHPNVEGALMVNAVITNTAGFSQPYPRLLVSMSNVRGQTVAQRYFTPGEYLQSENNPPAMEPGKSVSISLEVMDPGQDALAFELDFL